MYEGDVKAYADIAVFSSTSSYSCLSVARAIPSRSMAVRGRGSIRGLQAEVCKYTRAAGTKIVLPYVFCIINTVKQVIYRIHL